MSPTGPSRSAYARVIARLAAYSGKQICAGGFQLAVRLEVSVPNTQEDVVRQLVEQAHQVCPYSNATRGNIDVATDVVWPLPEATLGSSASGGSIAT